MRKQRKRRIRGKRERVESDIGKRKEKKRKEEEEAEEAEEKRRESTHTLTYYTTKPIF